MIPHGLPYCAECAPIAEAERAAARERKAEYRRKKYNKNYNKQRDPKYRAFYDSKEWKITSRTKLQQAGYKCQAKLQGCQGLAVEVHHIKPIQTAEGWELRLDWDNLEPVCTACHNGRHQRFKPKQDDGVLDMREIMKNL
jgi:5-methylcytosine-specific restriction endonuclease McrA